MECYNPSNARTGRDSRVLVDGEVGGDSAEEGPLAMMRPRLHIDGSGYTVIK